MGSSKNILALILSLGLTACGGAPPIVTSASNDPQTSSQDLSRIQSAKVLNNILLNNIAVDPSTGRPSYYAVNGTLMLANAAELQISRGYLGCFIEVKNFPLLNGQTIENLMISTGTDTATTDPVYWMEISKFVVEDSASFTLSCVKNKASVKRSEVVNTLRNFLLLKF